jgi:aspartyl-tRNA(Asn)/glutamyl-tRNA(Gln) amidotransferase subunit C
VLTDADVRRIARLARVAIADSEVASVRADLAAILRHADALRSVDLAGIEPMTSPVDATARMRDDTAGPGVSTEAFLAMAPETVPPFLKVPKVLGDGSSA